MERSIALLTLCASIAFLAPGIMLQVQAQPGFISIDCGAPNPYTDYNISVNFVTDKGFIDSGKNMQISTKVIDQLARPWLKNLMSFPNGTRNCYTLKPNEGKGNTYLIRASFWYGDYDGENQPPIFDLHIDVNYWATVDVDENEKVHYEIVYVAQRDDVQVCLVNIGQGVPFISSLELRTLDNSIYQIKSGFLVLSFRYDVGGLTWTTRFPDDVYDRIWERWSSPGLPMLNPETSACDLSKNNDAFKVPGKVLCTAQTADDANTTITFSITTYNSTYNWIGYFHFAEIQSLPSGQQREFTVSTSDGQFMGTVRLEHLTPVTVVSTLVSGFQINFLFKATTSQPGYFPPIVNALEIFTISELPNIPTAQNDVKALTDTKAEYNVNKDSWQGDPCAPSKFVWDGLNCSYGNPPRVILLNLSSSNLMGIISSSLSSLSELESLDLSNNQLTGAIPETLANLPKLRILNLSGNKLNGSVPEALKRRRDDKKLDLRLDNNPDLCQRSSCPKKKAKNSILVPVVVSASVIFVVIFVLTVGLIRWKQTIGLAKLISYKSGEISRIINKGGIIGEGAFGKVYLCTLDDGTRVAVKELSKSSWQGRKEFQAELLLSIRAHHGNLVSLLGYCDRCKKMALVYEYMANGNLQEHLTGKKPNVLNWKQRLQIALDVAHGLEYLHNGCKPAIIHRDLKTSNILLDENMVAKISDFGLSRDFTAKSGGYVSSSPLGTPGYIPPECRNLNKKSDVYSFGIVLFELITGHPAMMQRFGNKSVEILDYVTPFIKKGNNMLGLMDSHLEGTVNIDSARKAIEIAESCTRKEPADRPDIGEVLTVLKALVPIELALETKLEEGEPNEQLGMTSSEHEPDAAATAN